MAMGEGRAARDDGVVQEEENLLGFDAKVPWFLCVRAAFLVLDFFFLVPRTDRSEMKMIR